MIHFDRQGTLGEDAMVEPMDQAGLIAFAGGAPNIRCPGSGADLPPINPPPVNGIDCFIDT